MSSELELRRWSEALAAIARTGLGFTESQYERERFAEVLDIAADIAANADVAAGVVEARPVRDAATFVDEWLADIELGVAGYVTPKVAVGAVVGNAAGEILLIQRSDSGVWLYPTGWADVGYSAAEVAVKEVAEETGIDCRVDRLIACYDGLRHGFSARPLYSLVFSCQMLGGELAPHPLECTDVGWFARDALPEPLASDGHWVDQAFAAIAGEEPPTWFDQPRPAPWRAESAEGAE